MSRSLARQRRDCIARLTAHYLLWPVSRVEKQLYLSRLLDSRKLRLPDFLGIGSPQSASTWLHAQLACHPDIFLPTQRKEIAYFDRHFHRTLRWYAEFFQQGEGKRKGEVTPAYCILPRERIVFLRELLPSLKLILTIRNPIDRAWSAARRVFSRYVVKGTDMAFDDIDLAEFRTYFDRQYRYRMCERNTWGEYDRRLRYGDYSAIIDRWTSVFPADQLHIVLFDEIVSEPRQALDGVLRHLGVRTDLGAPPLGLEEPVNRNPSHRMPDSVRSYLEQLYAPELERLAQRLGGRISAWRVD